MSTIADIKVLAPSARRLGGKEHKFRVGATDLHTGAQRQADDVWQVKHEDLMNLWKVIEGFPPETIDIGGGQSFESYVPLRHPLITSVIADGYVTEGIGAVTAKPTPESDEQYYSLYNVTITYSSPRFPITGPQALQSIQTTDGTVVIEFDDRANGRAGIAMPVPGYIYQITMHRVSQFDLDKYRANSGTVNNAPWRGMPRGTVLFKSPVTNEEYLSDGSVARTVTYPLFAAAYEHNFELNRTNRFYIPTIRDFFNVERPKYPYVDFTALFGI